MTDTQSKSPFVYWAQVNKKIYLRIDILGARDITAEVSNNGRTFSFSALNSDGQLYRFSLNLFGQVKKTFDINTNGAKPDVALQKSKESCSMWTSLVDKSETNNKIPPWLKIDFNRWIPEDDSSQDEENIRREDQFRNVDEVLKRLDKNSGSNVMSQEDLMRKINMFYGTYFVAYNVFMFMAHFLVLVHLLFDFIKRDDYLNEFWNSKFNSLLMCTVLQYLDVFHGLMGMTKSSWKTTILQVSGRLAVLLIVNGNPEIHNWLPVFVLMVNYLLGEQFRYPYYALNSLKISLMPITWLRYNHFLLMYPIGFTMEALIFLRSIPVYYRSGVYGLQLPNVLNISFNFGVILATLTAFVFPYAAFTLFNHMRRQRAKKMNEVSDDKGKKRV